MKRCSSLNSTEITSNQNNMMTITEPNLIETELIDLTTKVIETVHRSATELKLTDLTDEETTVIDLITLEMPKVNTVLTGQVNNLHMQTTAITARVEMTGHVTHIREETIVSREKHQYHLLGEPALKMYINLRATGITTRDDTLSERAPHVANAEIAVVDQSHPLVGVTVRLIGNLRVIILLSVKAIVVQVIDMLIVAVDRVPLSVKMSGGKMGDLIRIVVGRAPLSIKMSDGKMGDLIRIAADRVPL